MAEVSARSVGEGKKEVPERLPSDERGSFFGSSPRQGMSPVSPGSEAGARSVNESPRTPGRRWPKSTATSNRVTSLGKSRTRRMSAAAAKSEGRLVKEEHGAAAEALKKVADKSPYTRCYCEENVWWLCHRVCKLIRKDASVDWDAYAVFVSNASERCPVWFQRAARDNDAPCVWDYHVIFLCVSPSAGTSFVVDLDTTLPVPLGASTYVSRALAPALKLPPIFHPRVRVVAADVFLATFASDRRHMLGDDGTAWLSPPPPYAAVRGPDAEAEHNLSEFVDVSPDTTDMNPPPPCRRTQPSAFADFVHAAAHYNARGLTLDLADFAAWIDLLLENERPASVPRHYFHSSTDDDSRTTPADDPGAARARDDRTVSPVVPKAAGRFFGGQANHTSTPHQASSPASSDGLPRVVLNPVPPPARPLPAETTDATSPSTIFSPPAASSPRQRVRFSDNHPPTSSKLHHAASLSG